MLTKSTTIIVDRLPMEIKTLVHATPTLLGNTISTANLTTEIL